MNKRIAWIAALALAAFGSAAEAQTITTIAGGGPAPGTVATLAGIPSPSGLAVDAQNRVFIVSHITNRVYRRDPDGKITVVAGSGGRGFTGDGGLATEASLCDPSDVAIGPNGDLYISDTSNQRVRRVSATTGIITTVAGGGVGGDGGPAVDAQILSPTGIDVDVQGNIFVGDFFHYTVRRVDASTGIITTFAGGGTRNPGNGDGGPATAAVFQTVIGVDVDDIGNVYVTDAYENTIRKITAATGIISTVVGNGTTAYSGEAIPALATGINSAQGVTVDSSGNIIFTSTNSFRVFQATSSDNLVRTIAGTGVNGFSGDQGSPRSANVSYVRDVAVGPDGAIYFSDSGNNRVRRIDRATNTVNTIAGNGTSWLSNDGGLALDTVLVNPDAVAIAANGDLYISDTSSHRIRKLEASTGLISTVAGNGVCNFTGDGVAVTTSLCYPTGILLDQNGFLYIADSGNQRIRKLGINSGIITTVAGNGANSFGGDGGPATDASLSWPLYLTLDTIGQVVFSDAANQRIRKILNDGTIRTIAGTGQAGFSGDGGTAMAAQLYYPGGVVIDGTGNLYVADNYNHRVRRIRASDGTIETVAGSGTAGYSGDNIPALQASFMHLAGITIDKLGQLYIPDWENHRVSRINKDTGYIETIAGNGIPGSTGDGGLAKSASIFSPADVALDESGNLYIAENGSSRVRKVPRAVVYDSTPPVLSPSVSGTAGSADWYTSNVAVQWSVTDPESAITSRTGCSVVTLAEDSVGTTYTCSATSLGGTSTNSIIVKRDSTAPVATATPSPVPNSYGWNKGSVSVAFTGTDATSGVASCSNAVNVFTEGDNQASSQGTCTDNAGNVSVPVTYSPVRIDLTEPLVSAAATPSANTAGWNKTPVLVVFLGIDSLSGIAANGCSVPVTLASNGTGQSATGSCTDIAGNNASATVSRINIDLTQPIATAVVSPAANVANWHRTPVTVSFAGTDSLSGSGVASCSVNAVVGTDGAGQTRSGTCTDLADNISSLASATVNLDQTPPTISITSPVASTSYLQNSSNTASYTCSDATSGTAACLGTVPSGNSFSTTTLGANTFTVQALDVAGNSASKSVSYTVVAPSPFTLSPTSLAFGDRLLNTSTSLVATIRNTSTVALSLTAPTLSGANSNQFTLARSCGTSLSANASCTITATFRPTSVGAKSAAFSLRIGTSTQTVNLSGTGVAVAFTLSPTSIAFPNQARNTTGSAQVVTVANQTVLPITFSTIALSGNNSNQFILTKNCGTTLAANSSCTLNVAFRPTSLGSKLATLTVTPTGATAKTVALTGTGL